MTIAELIAAERLPPDYAAVVERHWQPLAGRVAAEGKRPLVVGINGAQGSGKTTLCRFLELLLAQHGLRAVTLALDDLYLTRAERMALAQAVHPLLATRGVPGTHDTFWGSALLDDLTGCRAAALPRFDKAADDRDGATTVIDPPVDVVLFEGWCVGTVPQPAAMLDEPVNALEAEEDADGTWRRWVNARLAGDYPDLFARIDLLVMLKVGGFDDVLRNRQLQEHKLAKVRGDGAGVMATAELERFVMHYERLTRWTLAEMPARADIVIPIGPDQRPI